MTPSILRIILGCAVLLGVAIVANIFADRQRTIGESNHVGAQAELAGERGERQTTNSRTAEQDRLLRAIRRELHARGYLPTLPDSDTLDVLTQAAVLAFEFDRNLALTARASHAVLKSIVFSQPTATVSAGIPASPEASQFVQEIQRALVRLGYSKAAPNGQLDRETRNAIRTFERARGLEASGRPSASLVISLGSVFDAARLATTPKRQAATSNKG